MTVFAGRDVWVFDLDNTLYPADSTIYNDIGARMTAFIARELGVSEGDALELRERYFHAYGATVVGLVRHHGCDPQAFLQEVHDIAIRDVAPNPALNALIATLPGRRFVFTNGPKAYARRVVELIGLAGAFDAIVSLEDNDFLPKPNPDSFCRFLDTCAIDPHRAVMFEDHVQNLETAAAFGMGAVLVGPRASALGGAFDIVAPDLTQALQFMLGIDRTR